MFQPTIRDPVGLENALSEQPYRRTAQQVAIGDAGVGWNTTAMGTPQTPFFGPRSRPGVLPGLPGADPPAQDQGYAQCCDWCPASHSDRMVRGNCV
jgi:hypothetical protein